MTTIILGRHAESEWVKIADASPVKRFGGRMNECPLSKEGKAQSRRLGIALPRSGIQPDAFYSSIAVRAVDTCKLSTGVDPYQIEDLQELTWGDWEGQPRSIKDEEGFKQQRLFKGFDFRPPNGESPNDVRSRALKVLWGIHQQNHRCALVFTHQNVIKNLIRDCMGWNTPELLEHATVDTCSLTTVTVVSPTQLKLVRFNETI